MHAWSGGRTQACVGASVLKAAWKRVLASPRIPASLLATSDPVLCDLGWARAGGVCRLACLCVRRSCVRAGEVRHVVCHVSARAGGV